MKKNIIYLSLLIFLVACSFLGWKFLYKSSEEKIPFSEAKVSKGTIEEINNKGLALSITSQDFDPALMQIKEKKELLNFVPYKKIKVEEYIDEVKAEDIFRKEESDFLTWRSKPDEEKSIFNFLFPPSWNKSKAISFSGLEKGDLVEVVYYNNKSEKTAVIINKSKKEKEEIINTENQKKEVRFSADILEVSDLVIKVKLVTAIDLEYKEGVIIDLAISPGVKISSLLLRDESDYKNDIEKADEERKKIKEAGGNVFQTEAPSRYTEKDVLLRDLDKNVPIKIHASLTGEDFFVSSIQQIKK